MGQFQDTIYKEYPLVVRDVTASQFAAQAIGAPKHPGIRYRVDGLTEYQWDGSQWVAAVSAKSNGVTGMIKNQIGDRMYAAPLSLGKNVILFGDSITQYNTATISSQLGKKQVGYWSMANALNGDRQMDLVVNAGIGSNTTQQMLDRISTDVLAYSADTVFVMGGTNDIGAATPAATIIENLKRIYSILRAAGRQVVALYCPGFGAASGSRAAFNAVAQQVNAWISAQESSGLIAAAVDTYTPMQTTAGAFADDKHPSSAGAIAMAKAIVDRVGLLFPVNLSSLANLLTNGLFLGGSTTNWTTGGSSGGSVGALVSGEAAIGNSIDVPVTFTDATSSAYLRGQALHASITPGEYVWMEADVTLLEATNLAGIQAQMQYQVDAVSTASNALYRDTLNHLEIGVKYRIRTIPAQLSGTSITICRPEFWAYGAGAGGCKFRVENVKVFKRA